MTDPRRLLEGPPTYLPPELADLLRSLLTGVTDRALRLAIRRWGEACFQAGYASGFEDPSDEEDRGAATTTYTARGYGLATVQHHPPATSDTPAFDALNSGRGRNEP